MNELTQGLGAWANGWKTILTHRSLFLITLIPFTISFLGAVASIWLIWVYYPPIVQSMLGAWMGLTEGTWFAVLYYPLAWLGGLLVSLLILYVSYGLHMILAAPFYSLLAEKALKIAGKQATTRLGFFAMFRAALLKGLIFLFCGIVLFICSWIPGVNFLTVGGTLLLMAFDCMDYSLEASGLTLRRRWHYVRAHKGQWIGMAGGLALTLLLPGLTLLVIPGAVVGAALTLEEIPQNEPRTLTS